MCLVALLKDRVSMQLTDGGFTNAQASMRLSAYDPMRPHMHITIGANLAPSLAPECGIYVCVCAVGIGCMLQTF